MENKKYDFSQAIILLKKGERVTRAVWTSSTYLYLVRGSVFEVNRVPLSDLLPIGTKVIYEPHIDILNETPTGEFHAEVWQANNSDLLADDWMVSPITGSKIGIK